MTARGLDTLGQDFTARFGKPKAILALSAHWFTRGTFVQTAETPRQIYDMYGFPKELYEFSYPAKGDPALAARVMDCLGNIVSVNNDWGIDHGSWTVLCHVFPKADVPVVQLSIDSLADPKELYALGEKLAPLRSEGYLILGSGNIVHNLRLVEDVPYGSKETEAFNKHVIDLVKERKDAALISYENLPYASYAVPTPDHYLPLLYMLGAAKGEAPVIFNNHCEMASLAMTGFAFGF